MEEQDVSRRSLLKTGAAFGLGALVLGGGGFALHSCRQKDDGGLLDFDGDLSDPYDIWRQVQKALRASPDHAMGRARALVEAGDVAAIHKFVRDEIRLMSATGDRFFLGHHVKWGARAALRAGAGTAREKAEILADLIRQTGREADVMEMAHSPQDKAADIFYRDFETSFDPPVKKEQVERWRRALKQPETKEPDYQAQEQEIARLSRELRGMLSDEQKADYGRSRYREYHDGINDPFPVVRFTDPERGELYADPIRPAAELTPASQVKASKAREASKPLPVSISLSVATLEDPRNRHEIISGAWGADELAGRQVRIGFKPFGNLQTVLSSRIADLRAFTPFLSVQALDGGEIAPERTLLMGESFTLEGDRITEGENGDTLINGKSLGDGTPSGHADKVASVEVEVDAARFPDIRVLAYPKDAQGAIVDGLSSSEFGTRDEGEAVGHMLVDRERVPHILFLADSSASMPRNFIGGSGAWQMGSAMVELIDRVKVMATAVHPGAVVTVQSTDSNMWKHLLKHVGSTANLIIYATDGDLDGRDPTPQEITALDSGPKAIVMDVRARLEERRARHGDKNIFDAMAQATNGVALDVTAEDTAQVEDVIRRFLNEEARTLPYILTYRAPANVTGTRQSAVTVGKASGEGSYEVGAASAPPRKVAAIYATVKVGRHQITRLLAGREGRTEMTGEEIDELHGAVLGTHLLAFEGPPPSVSTILDDIITARLSMEGMAKVGRDTNSSLEDMLGAIEKGWATLPNELAGLLMRSTPMSGKDFCFAEQGMRVVLHSEYVPVNSKKLVSRADIMPFNHAHAIAEDRAYILEKAADASLRLAATEATLFPVNTAALLKDKPLTVLADDHYRNAELGLAADQVQAWRHFRIKVSEMISGGSISFSPADGSVRASWTMTRETGEIFAILPDGSGGGERIRNIERQLQDIDKVIGALNMIPLGVGALGLINPIGAVALTIVATYGQSLARIYAAAAMAIILMDSSGIAPAVRRAIIGFACNIVKSIFLGIFGAAGKSAANAVNLFAFADNLDSITGIAAPFACQVD